MERSVTLAYRSSRREFVLSNKTKPNTFRNLVRKAFNLQPEIRWLRSAEGVRTSFEELVAHARGGEF